MENIDLFFLLLLCGGILLLILAVIIKYLMEYFDDINYVKMEMRRADSWNEYVYWRRELRTLRWCIIPGLTVDRVKAVKKFFYHGKYAKKREKGDGFISMLLPSVLGIGLCCICLVGGTFAWFTASQDVPTQNIVAAKYSVEATVKDTELLQVAQNGSYTLEAGKEYVITLKATGTASTGYCFLKLNGKIFKPTVQFPTTGNTDREIAFTLKINEAATLVIEPQWGSVAWENAKIEDGGNYIFGEEKNEQVDPPIEKNDTPDATEETNITDTPETTEPSSDTETDETKLDPEKYIVQSGDTLDKIAKLYNTTSKKLAAYNDIDNPSLIYPGQTIKIPPADWEIPEATTSSETSIDTTITEPAETTVPQETTDTEKEPSESDGIV